MAKSMRFTVDDAAVSRALKRTPEAAHRGAVKGLHESMRDWQRQSREAAPVDKNVLRPNILADSVDKNALEGRITSNAYRNGFNYAYYQHNVRGNKYLTDPLERNGVRYLNRIHQRVLESVRGEGWQ